MNVKHILALLSGLLLPLFAAAQTNEYVLLQKIGSLDRVGSARFATYAQEFIYLVIGLSAVLAVIMIVWGGFLWMLGEAMQTKKEGQEKIKDAALGLLLLLSSYLILYTINPDLLKLSLTPPPTVTQSQPREILTVEQRTAQVSREARGEWTQSKVQATEGQAAETIEIINAALDRAQGGTRIYPQELISMLELDREELVGLRENLTQASAEVDSASGVVANAIYNLENAPGIDQNLETALANAYQDLSAASNELRIQGARLDKRSIDARIIPATCANTNDGRTLRRCFATSCNAEICPNRSPNDF